MPDDTLDPAQVLEDAADLLLIHGRCKVYREDVDGSLCVLGALTTAIAGHAYGSGLYESPSGQAALAALAARAGVSVGAIASHWNDRAATTDDDVRDALLLAAKDLRNGGWDPRHGADGP